MGFHISVVLLQIATDETGSQVGPEPQIILYPMLAQTRWIMPGDEMGYRLQKTP